MASQSLERNSSIQLSKVVSDLRTGYNCSLCLHPDAPGTCSSKPINAHMVPKAQLLNGIAQKGKVYGVNLSFPELWNGKGPFRQITVGKASVRPVFCDLHDKVFSPVEDGRPFLFSPEQCFVLGYRAICRGVYLAERQRETIQLQHSAARRSPLSVKQQVVDHQRNRECVARALRKEKRVFDLALQGRDFSDLRFSAIEFHGTPEILCSDLFLPVGDFSGQQLQPLTRDSQLRTLTLSIIGTAPGQGAIVFAWQKRNDDVCQKFTDSLRGLPPDRIPDSVVRVVFSFGENFFLSPQWWEGLDKATRAGLERRFIDGKRSQPADCLVDDELRLVNWKISRFRP